MLKETMAKTLKRRFLGIAERYGCRIGEQEVMPDHIQLFVSAPLRFCPAELVKILKSVSWIR
jgi:putative transposase